MSKIISLVRTVLPELMSRQILGIMKPNKWGSCFSPDGILEYWYYFDGECKAVEMLRWCFDTFGTERFEKNWFLGSEMGCPVFFFDREEDLTLFLLRWQ